MRVQDTRHRKPRCKGFRCLVSHDTFTKYPTPIPISGELNFIGEYQICAGLGSKSTMISRIIVCFLMSSHVTINSNKGFRHRNLHLHFGSCQIEFPPSTVIRLSFSMPEEPHGPQQLTPFDPLVPAAAINPSLCIWNMCICRQNYRPRGNSYGKKIKFTPNSIFPPPESYFWRLPLFYVGPSNQISILLRIMQFRL